METIDKLRELILQLGRKNITAEMLTPEARFFDDLGFDSLNMTELLVLAETTFNISIEIKELHDLFTLAQAAKFLDKKTAK